jgi:Phage integrase, N-terminal SAM-like domain
LREVWSYEDRGTEVFYSKPVGRLVLEINTTLEKYWPKGNGRFRRRFRLDQKTIAGALERKIERAIADGTWPELKRQLEDPPPKTITVAEFAKVYLSEYCVDKENDLEFKRINLMHIERILGHVELKDVRRKHGHHFVTERRKEGVKNGTINRGIAVLRNMFRYAIEKEHITVNHFKDFEELGAPAAATFLESRTKEPAH